MTHLQRVLHEHQEKLLTLAEIAESISASYTAAIREHARKQVYDNLSNISYGYAMGLWTALFRVEGVREGMWMEKERAITRAIEQDKNDTTRKESHGGGM